MWSDAGLVGLVVVTITAVCRVVQFAIALRRSEPGERPEIIRALNEGGASGAVARRAPRRGTTRGQNTGRTDAG
ncbi:hypothetical protein ADL03_27235 [Nocardia sp. NRRL S-836]|nr:hypothetical protein ADL03_27235 [Nocardia sp. NRRL S-836]